MLQPPIVEAIGDLIVRIHASEDARVAALPSLALERPWPALEATPVAPHVEREFTKIQNRHGDWARPNRRILVRVLLNGREAVGEGSSAAPLLVDLSGR